METIFKKLVVDGKTMKIFSTEYGKPLPSEIKKLLVLKGVEVTASTPDEFLGYYESKYGSLPDIGDKR